jgi:hypothetical protein
VTQIIHGNSLEVLATLEADSFDSGVTDPPYELSFMSKKWDGTGIAFNVELWRAVYRVLKPGAYLFAFGGTRTYHRMVCAIEDAGFEMRDSIHWIYGSGFCKSLNVSRVLREGRKPEASDWDGWGTALKPCHEIVVVAKKPLEFSTQQDTIGSCLSLLYAKIAEKYSVSNQTGPEEGSSSALPNAERKSNTLANSLGSTDMSLFGLDQCSDLNTVSRWRSIWEDHCLRMSMSTTETETSQTIESKTLRCLLSEITQGYTPELGISLDGLRLRASLVEEILREESLSSLLTQSHSVVELVTSYRRTNFPEGAEAIIVARKPFKGTVAANVLAHGTGALNIDACRVPRGMVAERGEAWARSGHTAKPDADKIAAPPGDGINIHPLGGWPGNVVLTHDARCGDTCHPTCPVAVLGEQSGSSNSSESVRKNTGAVQSFAKGKEYPREGGGHSDSGTAARYFNQSRWSERAMRSGRRERRSYRVCGRWTLI